MLEFIHPLGFPFHTVHGVLKARIMKWFVIPFSFLYFLGSKITADGDCSHEIKKTFAPWKKSYDHPREHIKKQRCYFANNPPSLLGIDRKIAYANRKYHSGLMWGGVLSGFAGV